VKTTRLVLFLLGAVTAGYGGWLLQSQLDTTLLWLVGGPLLHDALVAPLVGLIGLALSRLLTDRVHLAWITAGLVTTATLLLIAVPLLWRPADAPPNPGLPDHDYPLELTIWLAILWAAILTVLLVIRPIARRASRR
jgi:hypothetical protein